jgi:hypothetical protein
MCGLGWMLDCQCVHRIWHQWNKWIKIVTTKPKDIAMIKCISITMIRIMYMRIRLDMLFLTHVLWVLHYWIRWDENNFVRLKILHDNKLDVFMPEFDVNIE